MSRLLIAAAIVAVAALVAAVLRRRRPDAPTQARHGAPTQLDRRDFPGPDMAWLVVAFTSATCHTCADVAAKVAVLASGDVATAEVEYGRARELHARYAIAAVPTVVVADRDGVVHASFLGPVSATDLWAAVAAARGS